MVKVSAIISKKKYWWKYWQYFSYEVSELVFVILSKSIVNSPGLILSTDIIHISITLHTDIIHVTHWLQTCVMMLHSDIIRV